MTDHKQNTGFESVQLHRRFLLIGSEIKGWKIIGLDSTKRNPMCNCVCHCGTEKLIYLSQLQSKRANRPVCNTCTPPNPNPVSKPDSKFFKFWKLYANIHKKNLRAVDFPTFHSFMEWIIEIMQLERGSAFRWDIPKMGLRKWDTSKPHSKENTRLRIIWENGTPEYFSKQDKKEKAA